MLPCSCDDGELMHFTRCSHSLWSESSKSSTKMTAVQFPSKSSSTRSTSLLGRLRRTKSSSSSKSTTSTVSILNPLFYTDLISFLGDKVLGQSKNLNCNVFISYLRDARQVSLHIDGEIMRGWGRQLYREHALNRRIVPQLYLDTLQFNNILLGPKPKNDIRGAILNIPCWGTIKGRKNKKVSSFIFTWISWPKMFKTFYAPLSFSLKRI